MKREIRQKIIKCFLSLEIAIMLFFYLFGVQGLPSLYRLSQENGVIKKEIDRLRVEVGELDKTIQEWHTYPYCKEKIAREQLQMAYPDDCIYYIPHSTNKGT